MRRLVLLGLGLCAACSEPKPPTQKPFTVTTRARGEGFIALDETYVYWLDRGTELPDPAQRLGKAWRDLKVGGTPTALASGLAWPKGLAMDATHLYWASFGDGKVLRLDKKGGESQVLVEGQASPRDVAIDSSDVYFLTTPGELKRVPKSGGAAVTLAAGRQRASRLAVDGTAVYWLEGGLDAAVMKCRKDGSGLTTLVRGVREPGGLALDDEAVYWVERSEGLVRRIEKDGGAPRTLAREQWNATQLALDREYVWWQVGERIFRVRKGGGKAVQWTRGAQTVSAMAVDGRNVYWLDVDGAVRAIAK